MKVKKKQKAKTLSLYTPSSYCFQGNSRNQALFWWLWALFSADTGEQVTAITVGTQPHMSRDYGKMHSFLQPFTEES